MATSAAMTASTVSNVPTVRGPAAGLDAGGGVGALAGPDGAGRATAVPGRVGAAAVAAGGTGGAGRCEAVVGAPVEIGRAAVGAAVAGVPTGAEPVGGSDGSLIVGAEVGLGGSAMRTVSFFGCTFAASGGFGGTGESGVGSAINCAAKVEFGEKGVKPLIPRNGKVLSGQFSVLSSQWSKIGDGLSAIGYCPQPPPKLRPLPSHEPSATNNEQLGTEH